MDDDIYSDSSDVSSRLDDIESKIDSLDTHHSSDSGWVWVIVVCAIIGLNIGSCDAKFSIPKTIPNELKSKVLSTGNVKYNIIYDENFSGSATYYPDEDKVEFYIVNNSKDPYWLDDIKAYLWTKDDVGYGLKITDISSDSYGPHAVINPIQGVALVAVCQNLPPSESIKGFSLNSRNQPKIRFGYERLGRWDRIIDICISNRNTINWFHATPWNPSTA